MPSRRQVLKGIGATLSLPFLESLPAATGRAPVRMACLFMPNGVHPDRWTPDNRGTLGELPQILAPLETLKSHVNVLSQLQHKGSARGDGHYVKTSGWLTGTTITQTDGRDINANGTSMDQAAAAAIGGETALPSIELGTEAAQTGVDKNVDYTRLYANHISWRNPTSPLPCEISPRAAFDRLFRARLGNPRANAAAADRSILDLVLGDAKSLQSGLGSADRQKLDEYLESVRAVERRIEHEEKQLQSGNNISPEVHAAIRALDSRITSVTGGAPGEDELGSAPRIDPTEHVRLMLDIMVLAFWSDSTRIGSFMFGNAVSNRNFSFLDGVSGGHHQISHHSRDKKSMEAYARIATWHTSQYAYMLSRMAEIQEPGGGTLLDNSMVLFGSGLRDGNTHSPRDLPLVLAGTAGGQIATGRHIKSSEGTPMANLFVTMHQCLGLETTRFADSQGGMKKLLA